MTQVFKFQMIWSNNPLTIAEVHTEHDAVTFRHNPEWYEIIEPQVTAESSDAVLEEQEVKVRSKTRKTKKETVE